VYLAGGVLAVGVLWRATFALTATLVSVNEGLAEVGLLALAVSLVGAAGGAAAWRRRLSPDAVFSAALRRLRADAELQRRLGAPLTASDTRAFLLSGGDVVLRDGWRPALRSRRCHLLVPVEGPLGRGVASCEAKRVGGQYVFKLLAVDLLPPASGRLLLSGDAAAYAARGVLSELRDALLVSLATQSRAAAVAAAGPVGADAEAADDAALAAAEAAGSQGLLAPALTGQAVPEAPALQEPADEFFLERLGRWVQAQASRKGVKA